MMMTAKTNMAQQVLSCTLQNTLLEKENGGLKKRLQESETANQSMQSEIADLKLLQGKLSQKLEEAKSEIARLGRVIDAITKTN